eukprot:9251942-Pyramimonas_sp.AAC.1
MVLRADFAAPASGLALSSGRLRCVTMQMAFSTSRNPLAPSANSVESIFSVQELSTAIASSTSSSLLGVCQCLSLQGGRPGAKDLR